MGTPRVSGVWGCQRCPPALWRPWKSGTSRFGQALVRVRSAAGHMYLNGVQKSCSQSTMSILVRFLVRAHEEHVIRDGCGRHAMDATEVGVAAALQAQAVWLQNPSVTAISCASRRWRTPKGNFETVFQRRSATLKTFFKVTFCRSSRLT